MLTVDGRDEISEEDEGDNAVEMSFSWDTLWPKLYESMFDAGKGDTVRLLRRLRDEVLMASSEGRASVGMLYRLSWEIAALLVNDRELRLQTAEVIRQLLPEAACLADGETILLTSSKHASCEALLDRFAARRAEGKGPGCDTSREDAGRKALRRARYSGRVGVY